MAGGIMVIDGVPTNRIVLKVRLSAVAHEVMAIGSAAQALAQLALKLPRIIIIGGGLPDAEALALCRAIRDLPDCAHLPILLQADSCDRLKALYAGADDILDPSDDDSIFFARIRSLLRQSNELIATEDGSNLSGVPPPDPAPRSRPRAVFIADQIGNALGWRFALQDSINCEVVLCDPERALAEAQTGPGADLYLIAADIHRRGDGLRLLSELKSRAFSRDAAFIVALRPERAEMTAHALDLGAGDILPMQLTPAEISAEAALRIDAQLSRKFLADRRRREQRRNLLWAMTDPLTGLHNRRYALMRLRQMIEQTAEEDGMLAVLALDIDRFKRVNDEFGHGAGDQVLIRVADRLRDSLPEEALLARIGGEEFIAALPVHDRHHAFDYAEAIRLAIAATAISVQGNHAPAEIEITISAGLAVIQPHSGQSATALSEMLLLRADRALLSAKSQGRNRIILSQQGLAA